MLVVRKGYTVVYGARRFPSGTIVPNYLVDEVMIKDQLWKMENLYGKGEGYPTRGEESEAKCEEPEEQKNLQEEKEEQEITNLIVNRTMKSTKVKKR